MFYFVDHGVSTQGLEADGLSTALFVLGEREAAR